MLDSFRRAAAATSGEGTAGGGPAASAATTTASAAAISRPVVGLVAAGSSYARGVAPSPPATAALGPAGRGSGSTPTFIKPSSGLVPMDALVAAVKAALPERGAPGGSGVASGSSADLRMALQRRHAALFVLQDCGLAGPGDAAASATVHVNQFRKIRVSLTKMGERQSWAYNIFPAGLVQAMF